MAGEFNIPKTSVNNQIAASKLIIKSFALNALVTDVYAAGMPNSPTKDDPSNKGDLPQYKSMLGTAVFSDLEIDETVNGVPPINIPTALFTVSQRKNIVTTPIQGRDGTVKEYISMGDYQVTIRGVLAGKNGIYPRNSNVSTVGQNTLDDLKKALVLNKQLKVNSWYLRQFDIYYLVITDFDFPQVEGQYSTQAFSITALSDMPFELNITN